MLKRFILFLFISTVLFSYGNAQNKKGKRNFLSFSAGPSFPVGDFASTDPENELAGFANTGEEIAISYTYKFDQHFGLSATLSGQRNGFNARSLKKQLIQKGFVISSYVFSGTRNVNSPPDMPPLPPPVYYSNWTVRKHAWMSGSLLLGGTGMFPLDRDDKLVLIVKGMAGMIYVSSPEVDATSITDTTEIHLRQNSKSAFGFSYSAYGGVCYQTGSNVSLLLGINYQGSAHIRFSEVTAKKMSTYYPSGHTDLISMSESSVTGSQKQIIQTIGLNFGIQLAL